jgi:hypothetical protein
MTSNKQELDCFALLIKDWNSFYSFGINRGNPKLKTDLDYEGYEKNISLELTCETYQDEVLNKLSKGNTVLVHFVPKSEKYFQENCFDSIGFLEVHKKYKSRMIISIPVNDLSHIFSMLQHSKPLGISFTNTKMSQNKSFIKSFDIITDFKPEEF